MKKIKLSFPYPDFPLIKQTPGGLGEWANYKFYINEEIEECDYWVVFNSLLNKQEQTSCPKGNTIFITAEPISVGGYNPGFVRQFSKVITCQKEIKHPDITYYLQSQPWHVGLEHGRYHKNSTNKSYDELKSLSSVPKTKELSLITSDKQFSAGHRQRYKFAMAIKEYFGERVDLFGRGVNNFNDKWDVLAPYKYSLAIENSAYDDYITEKLYDCYLAHTFPLYYGAPNVAEYFSPGSLAIIDINDLPGSILSIEKILNDSNYYQNHLAQILQAKDKCLTDYNLFGLIVNFIEQSRLSPDKAKVKMTLKQHPWSWDGLVFDLRNRIYWSEQKIVNFLKKIYAQPK